MLPRVTIMAAALLPVAALLPAEPAGAAARYSVRVAIDPSLEFVDGAMIVELEPGDVHDGRAVFWLYPNRLSVPPGWMDPMNRHWMYPYDFNPGWMKIVKVRSGGEDVTASVKEAALPSGHPLAGIKNAAVSVPVPGACQAAQGGAGACSVEIRYRIRVPKRFGLFGRTGSGLVMVTGWYPLLASAGEDGAVDYDAPPGRADVEVDIAEGGGFHVLVEDRLFEPGKQGRHVKLAFEGVAHISVALFPQLSEFTASCGGWNIRMLTLKPYGVPPDYKPGGEEAGGVPVGLPDVSKPDRKGHLLDIVCRGLELAGGAGLAAAGPEPLTVVEAPLRMEVVSSTQSVLFVSDRIYDVFPFKRFWKFHDLQLLRALFGRLALEKLEAAGRGYPEAALEADFVSSGMVDRYVKEVLEKEEYADDILKWGAFLASIDYILYSPMVQFREAYFLTVAEKDWLRDEPWAFMNLMPRGKLIYEKLADIVGEAKLAAVVEGLVAGEGTLAQLAAAAAGEDMGWFFEQWSHAYPSLNYKIKKVKTVKLPGGKRKYVVKVFRQGDSWIKEPVLVRFKFVGGTHEDRVWFEAGPEATLEVVSSKLLLNAFVDPEGRLFEDPALMKNNPRFDNALWQSLRPPVISSVSLWSSIYSQDVGFYALFNMRRKYDLIINYRFLVEASRFGYGLTTWVLNGFGRKLDLNTSSFYLGPLATVFYSRPEFGFERDGGTRLVGATTLSLGLFAMYDTVYFRFDPDKGVTLTAHATYHFNIADDGKIEHAMSTNVRAFYIYPFNGAHHIVLYGAIGGTFFDMPAAQLQSLSDRLALRGFESDETLGRIRMFAAVEYRHLWVYNLGWNFLDIAMIEGLKGVLFAGAGTVSDKDSYDGLFHEDRMFAEVGYGLALLVTYLGAYPNVIELDVALPLYPLPRDRPHRQPVGIYLSFNLTY